MVEYVCVNRCFHKGRFHEKGKRYRFDDKDVPRHFKKVGGDDPAVDDGKAKAPDEMTNAELMEALEKLEVEFPKRANKAELVELLKKAGHKAAVDAVNDDGTDDIFNDED